MGCRKKSIINMRNSDLFVATLLLLLTCTKTDASTPDWFSFAPDNMNVIFSGANHYGSYYSFYAACNRNNITDFTCKIYSREAKKKDLPSTCSTELHKSVDRLSNIPIRLTAIGSRAVLSWIDSMGQGNRHLVVRLVDLHYCQFIEHRFKIEGPIPIYNIVAFKGYFDVFFKSKRGGDDLTDQEFTKITFDVSGNQISETKSFFANVSVSDLRLSNSGFSGLSQILPVSFDDHGKGYYFMTRELDKIQTLDPDGRVKKTVQLNFMLNPKTVTFGYGSIGIPKYDAGVNKLIQYDANLENVRNITYELGEERTELGIFAIGLDEYILLSAGYDLEESRKTVYFSRIEANGRQSRFTRIKIGYPQDEFYLTFAGQDICVNGALLTEYGTYKKLNTVCLNRGQLDKFVYRQQY